jgi:hypothetical protein
MADPETTKKFSWVGYPSVQNPPSNYDLENDGGGEEPSNVIGGDFNPVTGAPLARRRTPEEIAADNYRYAKALWLARGGSDRTEHRAQVAAGIRPVIDARAPQAAGDPLAAAGADARQVRENWGWGKDPGFGNVGGSGSALWQQMTDHFNDVGQQKRQAVMDRLGMTPGVQQESNKAVAAIRNNPQQTNFDTPYGPVSRTVPTAPSAPTVGASAPASVEQED